MKKITKMIITLVTAMILAISITTIAFSSELTDKINAGNGAEKVVTRNYTIVLKNGVGIITIPINAPIAGTMYVEVTASEKMAYILSDISEFSNDLLLSTVDLDNSAVNKSSAKVQASVKASGTKYLHIFGSELANDVTITVKTYVISGKNTVSKVKLSGVRNIQSKKAKVSWEKLSDVNGYQIQYALNKKFTKSKKTTTATGASKTIKKLKKKKTYYFRVRAYVKVSGKKVYGKWSNVKKVKIKK